MGMMAQMKRQENHDTLPKRRLLITASTFPRWEKDTEPRFVLDYAKAMGEYYDVTVLVPAFPGAGSKEVLEGVKVERYHYCAIHKYETLCYPGAIVPRIKEKKIRIFLVPLLMGALYFKLKKNMDKFDIVHAHWLVPQGIVQSFIKDKPYIVTGHGGDITSLNFRGMRALKKKCIKAARAVTVVSEALKEKTDELCPGISASIIPMGCDTELFSSENRIENFWGQNDRKVVLFVGRLAEIKGVTYLIEAMEQVQGALLIIAGKGDREEELRGQAEKLGDKVLFIGSRTHEELATVYASADIFVAPSITVKGGGKEGFGLTIIEAMASGVPVIASKTGGITDILSDGFNGLFVEEKDADQIAAQIRHLMEDADLRETLVKNGRDTAQRYSYRNIAARYYELIEKNMGEQAGCP